jgi:hypothetical protein
VYTLLVSILVLSVLEGRTEELVVEGEEPVEIPEELELAVAEEVEDAGELVDDAVETENEVTVEVAGDVPRPLEDEAEEDAEDPELLVEEAGGVALLELSEEDADEGDAPVELLDDDMTVLPEILELPELIKLLVEDTGGVALLELAEEDANEGDTPVELLDDDIIVLPEILELPELLLKLAVLLPELIGLLAESKVLELAGLLKLLGLLKSLDELRDEVRELVEDAIEL